MPTMTDPHPPNHPAAGPGPAGGERGHPRRAGSAYPEAVDRLIAELATLPGIGRRSAERIAFHVLRSESSRAESLARAVLDVKRSVRNCSVCSALCSTDPCPVCGDASRDRSVVMVVEQPRDQIALELTGLYKGVYHVLMGRLSPLDGVGPGDLTIGALVGRVSDPARNSGGVPVREVVLGLNPTLEGDGTALYLAELLRARGVAVSRLARGLPAGAQLEHANRAVLADAIAGRHPVAADLRPDETPPARDRTAG